MQHVELWQFLAGLGFFLYGMGQLEHVLKNISGRRIKLFLQRNTRNLFKAILGGAVITGVVQSSSVVSLIVLAFVEAGIIQFRNALGVILGANLGTTLDSWLVASVGFKLDILRYALPVIAVTSIGMFFLQRRKNLYHLCSVFFALGILFLGLDFMKVGATVLVKDVDLSVYAHYNPLFFVLAGLILTAIIQSSSATIAVTLTAIHVGALTLPSAAAVVIGAEVGTTIKILLWGMTGSAGKKRVAWGNFIFNIFASVVALLSLSVLLHLIEHVIGLRDPLISLVFFQSSINIISIVLFVPFLSAFSNWLEKIIPDDRNFRNPVQSQLLPLLAVDEMRADVQRLWQNVRKFNRDVLCHHEKRADGLLENIKIFAEETIDIESEYLQLKQQEGDILGYYARTQELNFNPEDTRTLLQYAQAARLCIYAAKAVKDVEHNILDLKESVNTVLFDQRHSVDQEWRDFETRLEHLSSQDEVSLSEADLEARIEQERLQYELQASQIMSQMKKEALGEIEVSTLMNVHREILSSKKSLLRALTLISNNRG